LPITPQWPNIEVWLAVRTEALVILEVWSFGSSKKQFVGAVGRTAKEPKTISVYRSLKPPCSQKADFDSRKLLWDFLNVNGIYTQTCDIIKMAGA
jgi:hypothetical protein